MDRIDHILYRHSWERYPTAIVNIRYFQTPLRDLELNSLFDNLGVIQYKDAILPV